MELFGMTDTGRQRSRNEDALLINRTIGVLAVADGLGGHQAGEFASAYVIKRLEHKLKTAPQLPSVSYLSQLVHAINDELFTVSLMHSRYDGMGSTLVCALARSGRMFVVNIGDSRGYLWRDGKLTQLTIDHSHVQRLVSMGKITHEEMRRHPLKNVVTKSMGARVAEEPDVFTVTMELGDVFLLSSDGLTGMLHDSEIKAVLEHNGRSLKRAARELIRAANERGGKDNITVCMARITSDDIP